MELLNPSTGVPLEIAIPAILLAVLIALVIIGSVSKKRKANAEIPEEEKKDAE
ncbi:MAG: NPXTG-anchored protein [Oscillospiraceae bacterium]|jgi:hypothetical protein|nr:NPXTG-anchored protein [Oscillospiraceae bacterium]